MKYKTKQEYYEAHLGTTPHDSYIRIKKNDYLNDLQAYADQEVERRKPTNEDAYVRASDFLRDEKLTRDVNYLAFHNTYISAVKWARDFVRGDANSPHQGSVQSQIKEAAISNDKMNPAFDIKAIEKRISELEKTKLKFSPKADLVWEGDKVVIKANENGKFTIYTDDLMLADFDPNPKPKESRYIVAINFVHKNPTEDSFIDVRIPGKYGDYKKSKQLKQFTSLNITDGNNLLDAASNGAIIFKNDNLDCEVVSVSALKL